MASYTRDKKTTSRIIYALKTPTNWVEIAKVISACERDLSGRTHYDDLVTVDVGDDEVTFSFDASLIAPAATETETPE